MRALRKMVLALFDIETAQPSRVTESARWLHQHSMAQSIIDRLDNTRETLFQCSWIDFISAAMDERLHQSTAPLHTISQNA